MRYNWSNLKRDYLNGDYKTLKDFAEYKGIPYSTLTKKATNWLKLGKKIEEKAEEKTIEKVSDDIAEMNKKHILKAQSLIKHGSNALKHLDFDSASGAVQAIKIGIEIEREILLPKGKDNNITVTFKGSLPTLYGPGAIKQDE